jgi:hypothetical protein
MSNRVIIRVVKKDAARHFHLNYSATWGYLVVAEAVSHAWFGGSWIIDLMIVIGMFGLVRTLYHPEENIVMSHSDVRAWVKAGMPDDIMEWRRSENAKVTSG